MAFGQKTGSLKNLKKTLAKGSGQQWIKYIPKNGSMNVRFIQEPEEWVNYVEHFDAMLRKSFPCNGEQNCPGCVSGERKSSRYLANVVDRDDNERVVPLQMPKDLANRLVVRYERNGTLTDRDFELSRSGEGLDTVYDLDAGIVDKANIAKFTPLDLLKTLEDAYNNVFGDSDDGDDEDVAPTPKARARSKAAAVAHGGDEDDDDEPVEAPTPKARTKKAKAPEPEFVEDEGDEDEDETDDEPEAEEDEAEIEYDEDTLRALPLGALRAVARDFGVNPKGKSVDAIVDEIMLQADDDEA